STVAGTGIRGFSGDGGSALSAELTGPQGVALDSSGNLYIADTFNNRIRKVSPAGIISTVAGSAAMGFSGDDGPATAAQLGWPSSIAIDSGGGLLIGDSANNRIRRVSPAGVIGTIAGGGTAGDGSSAVSVALGFLSGVSVDSASNIFIGEPDNGRIRK